MPQLRPRLELNTKKIDAEDDKLGVMRKNFLSKRAPKLIEVIVDSNARVIPQVKFGRPNEDMEPLLDDNVFSDFMLIQSMRQVK